MLCDLHALTAVIARNAGGTRVPIDRNDRLAALSHARSSFLRHSRRSRRLYLSHSVQSRIDRGSGAVGALAQVGRTAARRDGWRAQNARNDYPPRYSVAIWLS